MAPNGGSPAGKLADAIADFGGLDKLKEEFNAKGAGQFGSGWAWLIADNAGKLKITSTPNQDNPLMEPVADKGPPILGNAVGAHPFYPTPPNERGPYPQPWGDADTRDRTAEP